MRLPGHGERVYGPASTSTGTIAVSQDLNDAPRYPDALSLCGCCLGTVRKQWRSGISNFAQDSDAGTNAGKFPNVTYPSGVSPNPNAIAGAQSNQASPPKYPSPWGTGAGDWAEAYKKATAIIEQLTLEEKVNLTTGQLRKSLAVAIAH